MTFWGRERWLTLSMTMDLLSTATCIQASVQLGNALSSELSASKLSKRFRPLEAPEDTLEPARFPLGNGSAEDLSNFGLPVGKLAPASVHQTPHDDKIVFGRVAAHIRGMQQILTVTILRPCLTEASSFKSPPQTAYTSLIHV